MKWQITLPLKISVYWITAPVASGRFQVPLQASPKLVVHQGTECEL